MVNPDSIPRYEQPMDPPPSTPLDYMDSCAHCKACARAYRILEGPTGATEIAHGLACADCGQYEECEW